MEPITQPTTLQATLLRAYERQICTKKIVVRFKVDGVKVPPPRRIKLNMLFDDGTSKIVEAVLVSAYSNYAYYDLIATDAKEVYPHVDKIQRVEVVSE